jgi:hypothetical protein
MIVLIRSLHGTLPSLLPALNGLIELCWDAEYAASADRRQELEVVHSLADCDEDKKCSLLDLNCLQQSQQSTGLSPITRQFQHASSSQGMQTGSLKGV